MATDPSSEATHGSAYQPEAERRQATRKRLQRRAILTLANHETLVGKTVEASLGGISIMSPKLLARGTEGVLRFEFFFNGHAATVVGAVKVMNCACSGLDGFRVGMRFDISNDDGKRLMEAFLA